MRNLLRLGIVLCLITSLIPLASASAPPEVFIQTGCLGPIKYVCSSPDGKVLLTISSLDQPHLVGEPFEGIMKLWDMDSGREIRTFEAGHFDSVNQACFSPDGNYILTGSDDKSLILWECSTGKMIRKFTGHSDRVKAAVITSDGKYAISGSNDNSIRLWDLEMGKEIQTFHEHRDDVNSLSVTADGKYLLSSSIDGEVKLWDLKAMKVTKTYESHIKGSAEYLSGTFTSTISADGKYALISARLSFELLELKNGKKVILYTPKGSELLGSLCLTSDNQFIYYHTKDNTAIHIYNIPKKAEVKTITCNGSVQNLCAWGDGNYILAAVNRSDFQEYTVSLWDVTRGTEIKSFTGHAPRPIKDILWLEKCGQFVAGDLQFKRWNPDNGERVQRFGERAGTYDDIGKDAMSPDGRYLLAPVEGDKILLWDLETGKNVAALRENSSVNSVAFSPDGKFAVSGSFKGLRVWGMAGIMAKAAESAKILTFTEDESIPNATSVNSVAYSPDGKYLLSGDASGAIRLWDAAILHSKQVKLKKYWEFKDHTKAISMVGFSTDGSYALSASYDRSVKLWSIPDGNLLKTLSGHTGAVLTACFSPGGDYVLSGSKDKTMKLWKTATGEVVNTLTGHLDAVNATCFLTDPRYVISGSNDGTARLWNVETGRQMAWFVSFRDDEWISVTPEGLYRGSKNAAQYLNIRQGDQVRSLSDLTDQLARADLKLAVFNQ